MRITEVPPITQHLLDIANRLKTGRLTESGVPTGEPGKVPSKKLLIS